MTETNIPHIYQAMHSILGRLAVEKGGILPSNMGSSRYTTAEDVAKAVRDELFKEGLVLLPSERVVESSTTINKDRLNFHLIVTGDYRILSTKDGSEVTVTGTGEGVATGTAVAANIASTFALKNALLRTFLISEQSVEDEGLGQGKSSPNKASASPAAKAQQRVAKAASKPTPRAATSDAEKAAQAGVKALIDDGTISREDANKIAAKFKGDPERYQKTLAQIKSGDLD